MKVDYSKVRGRQITKQITVQCDAWGGEVELRRVTSDELIDAALAMAELEVDDEGVAVSREAMISTCLPLVSQTIVDGDERPFDSDAGREELANDHLMAVIQLIPKVLEINALSPGIAIDDAKKNLTPSNG